MLLAGRTHRQEVALQAKQELAVASRLPIIDLHTFLILLNCVSLM